MKCSNCSKRFIKGGVCLDCGKAYCENEKLFECPFCKTKLVVARIDEERLDSNVIEWLTLEALQIGLVGFKQIPPFLLKALRPSLLRSTGDYLLVLFPSKRASWKIANHFRRESGLAEVEYDDFFEQSRYALIVDPRTKRRFVFLNIKATPLNAIEFLIVFTGSVLSKIDEFREVDSENVAECLGKALFDHNAKLGIPFVAGDELTREYFVILQENLPAIYTEYIVLAKFFPEYLKEISIFLNGKIELLFSGIDYKRLTFLRGVYDIFIVFIHLSSLVALAKENQSLLQYINNLFNPNANEVRERLKEDFSDVNKCLDIIVEELSQKMAYESYPSYLETVSRILEKIFRILSPKYLKISEIGLLFKISEEFEKKIEAGEEPFIPRLGSVEKFSGLLLQLFHREDVYPEVRILAGQSLLGILTIRILKENSYLAYSQGLTLVQELAQLTVNNLSTIKERLSNEKDEYERIGVYAVCLALASFSQFCHIMNDAESASRLVNFSKSLAEQYKVLPMRVIHGWKDFVESHNYDRLMDVYGTFKAIDHSEHRYLEEHTKAIGHLASAILRKRNRKDEFKKAENHALAMIDPTSATVPPMTYVVHTIISSQAIFHLIRLFYYLLERVDIKTSLKKAWLEAQAMAATIAEIDPFNKFTLKTEILYSLILGDPIRTQKTCNRLKTRDPHSQYINRFVENVEKWLLESEKLRGCRFLIRVDIEESDIWEQLFARIVYTEMSHDLKRHIIGSEAVVFVEGISDVKILQQFAQKLIAEKQILFMDAQGFTNMAYHSEAKMSKRLEIPLFILFDGDTSTVKKKKRVRDRLVEQTTLRESRVLTLKKNSIEDYLLVPTAIKRAFPSVSWSVEEIDAFLKNRSTKRNKKEVLNALLNQLGLGKYDHEKAKSIVSSMKLSEIDAEVRQVFDLIAKRDNSRRAK